MKSSTASYGVVTHIFRLIDVTLLRDRVKTESPHYHAILYGVERRFRPNPNLGALCSEGRVRARTNDYCSCKNGEKAACGTFVDVGNVTNK